MHTFQKIALLPALLCGLALYSCTSPTNAAMKDKKTSIPDTTKVRPAVPGAEIATLGGGCFWCVEAIYEDVEGVYAAVSGYSGGTAATADYKTVCSGTTDHAEVVQVHFDPKVISFEKILEIFWNTHNPTTPNRQGNDVGPQYRSVIFYHSPEQAQIAEKSRAEVAPQLWDDKIVTEVVPFTGFWEAEAYHQDYFSKVGDGNPYCSYVIAPKVAKFRKAFPSALKKE
ncbi:MAG: hypothetical protein RL181_2568 [Bacteroidota bacterium]|jgi:peptide-methionine (S)-S-oxide reductase